MQSNKQNQIVSMHASYFEIPREFRKDKTISIPITCNGPRSTHISSMSEGPSPLRKNRLARTSILRMISNFFLNTI